MQNKHQEGHSVYIDETKVQKALMLARAGQQQLPQIPVHKTVYYFTVSHNNHCSVCEILITPVKHKNHPNFFFLPVRRYTKCCDNAPENELKQQHQTIYDVLIRPNQWRFCDDDSNEVKLPQNASPVAICGDHAELGLDHLRQTATAISSGTDEELVFRRVSTSPCHCIDMADEPNSSDTHSTEPRSKRKRRRKNDAADTISKKLLKTAETKPLESPQEDDADSCPLPIVNNLDGLPTLATYEQRERFAEHLQKLYSKTHDRGGQIMWANKRYSSDMRYLLRREKKIDGENGEADRSAKSSMLINRVASTVSNNDPECYCGVQVYNLFAKAGHMLTNLPGDQIERLKAADKIAELIRKKLPPLYGPITIFYAPAVIAALWKKDFENLCKDLYADHLAQHDVTKHVVKVSYDDDLYTYGVYLEKGCPVHGGQRCNTTSPNSLYNEMSGIEYQQAQSLPEVGFGEADTNPQESDPLRIFDNLGGNDGESLDEFGIMPHSVDSFWGFTNSVPDSQFLVQ